MHAHADEIRKLHEISKIESVDANASTSWRDRFNSSAMDLLKVCDENMPTLFL